MFLALGIKHCNAYAPQCLLWPVRLDIIFPHDLINSMNVEKKVIEHKMFVLIFSTILSETFLILRRISLDVIINVHRSSCKVPVTLVRF